LRLRLGLGLEQFLIALHFAEMQQHATLQNLEISVHNHSTQRGILGHPHLSKHHHHTCKHMVQQFMYKHTTAMHMQAMTRE
jgi:hypothetical protein